MATLRQIQETLSQSSGAQFLYQPVIDRALREQKRNITATRMLFPRKTWDVPKYQFNQRTNYPSAQATVEAPPTSGTGSVAATSSTYSQVSFDIKHWQSQLDLAEFSIQTARLNGDLMQLELEGAAQNAAWLEETFNFYGSAGATLNTYRPAWDGVDLLMSPSNKFNAASAPSFALLDALYDSVKRRKAASLSGLDYAYVMSPEMLSSFSRQFNQDLRYMGQATVYPRDDRGLMNGVITDNKNYVDAGIQVATYRGVPLIESTFIASLGQMGTVSASATGSDGVISAGTYYYYVEVVTDLGISLACAEVGPVSVSATNHVALTWTAPSIVDDEGNTRTNLFYRIHRTLKDAAPGTETLYAVVAAKNTTEGTVTGFTDLGSILDPSTDNTLYAVTVASSGSEAIADGKTTPRVNPTGHIAQDIWLLPRDPDVLCVPVVNEMKTTILAQVNARTRQVALTGDQVLAVRGPRFMAKAGNVYPD